MRHCLVGGHHILYQADAPCLVRIDGIPRQEISLGVPPTATLDPPDRTAAEGEQASQDFRLAQLSAFCRHDDIAVESDFETAGKTYIVDRDNQRFGKSSSSKTEGSNLFANSSASVCTVAQAHERSAPPQKALPCPYNTAQRH
jgi:hypothetical protein